jgi:8-amino-7-oxononanoate synthase
MSELNFAIKLEQREQENSLRKLSLNKGLIDFCSNDYLGHSQLKWQESNEINGAGASRLISGHFPIHEQAEQFIANYHQQESALLFNSGYDANLGLLSCIAQKNDTIIYDSLCHASIRDGIRLSASRSFSFKHNNTKDLKSKIKQSTAQCFVVVESVYSMDGDKAPLQEIEKICQSSNALLIVDEAHATGVYGQKGEGLCNSASTFARVHTFGKSLGCHGAVVLGSKTLIKYLINFSRPFIYTTAIAPNSVSTILQSYKEMQRPQARKQLRDNINLFVEHIDNKNWLVSDSAIQSIIIAGNDSTKKAAKEIQEKGFDVRPILYPTVEKGRERLRICLHSFNKKEDIILLCKLLNQIK